ncbi:DUF3667 domain-containing protein [Longimicrobium sp.]|uniref:DUF3667 domain-containing protein n=1 Tax=Longimicrobium sp. TaxID=2029185 RepID=UPI002E37FDA7|nr:DUF3667 domain-containing protein [Longimicrobium sp.]HEX6040458.1 DUF3667 domain-containing protein [Longimicrobium sp.]
MQSQPPAEASVVLRTCAHCGARGTTRFCGECGHALESVPVPGLLRETAAEVLGVEHGIVGTLRDQLIRPVAVYRAHLEGRAEGYVRPIKLFFLLAGLYMLLLSLVRPIAFEISELMRGAAVGGGAEGARTLAAILERRGLTQELLNERMQSGMNTATPLVVALALLPMAGLLKLMRRERPFREHVMFLLSFSNSVWLMSILTLPLYWLSQAGATVLMQVIAYVYMGLGFFAFYASRTRLRTAGLFAVYVVSDLVLSTLFGYALSVGVLMTVLFL